MLDGVDFLSCFSFLQLPNRVGYVQLSQQIAASLQCKYVTDHRTLCRHVYQWQRRYACERYMQLPAAVIYKAHCRDQWP